MSAHAAGLALLAAAMTVESLAQLFLKVGTSGGTNVLSPGARAAALRLIPAAAPRRWIGLGVATYGLEIVLYSLALRFLDVSVAFPLGSLCFVGVAVLSRFMLGERVGGIRCTGIALILAGVWLVAW